MDNWNAASWTDLVDDDFNMGGLELAAVRWYFTEGSCTPLGTLCKDQLNTCDGVTTPDPATSNFCGVTDELGNVLLSHAMGNDKAAYEKLHRFTELLRLPPTDTPNIPEANGLQCWKYRINGPRIYDDYADLCIVDDSASDASLRILGAYGIACAKQRAGIWTVGDVDFCADYLEQGNAIWGRGTDDHGEIKQLANLEYYLATGYKNQLGSPTANVSFRPDYYELQFLMDFAEYVNDPALVQGVRDMLRHYMTSMDVSETGNHIHRGIHGHFDALVSTYTCDADTDCSDGGCVDNQCGVMVPPVSPCKFMDQNDTWRAIPALSGLRNVHPEAVTSAIGAQVFDYWWAHYAGGNSQYSATDEKPMEIWANSTDGIVRCKHDSYKTLGMWIPLGAAMSATYTREAVDHLIHDKYNATAGHFSGAAYFGAYFSQFAQRAIGAATGMIDPAYWLSSGPGADFFTLTPCRALDTRSGAPYPSQLRQTLAVVGGPCPVPAGARAITVNVTVVSPSAQGFLTLFAGDGALPATSTINFGPGQVRANNATVALSSDGAGTIAIWPVLGGSGTVHVIVDVSGYYVTTPSAP